MKKVVILTAALLLYIGCVMIDNPDKSYITAETFTSCIRYNTDTTETRYISVCEVNEKSTTLKYIYQSRYKTGQDSVAVLKDSVLHVYIIEKYKQEEKTIKKEIMSIDRYKTFLINSKTESKALSDTSVSYDDYIWDKRILDMMYNKHIK